MKIFQEDTDTEIFIAENVKIGDKLKLEIKIEEQPVYGMKVTNCLVRDGLNWAEQVLLNDDGCPIDEEILGQFKYNKNLTRAMVSFQAHKFPYTSSVYYQCNVRLCLKQAGGCTDTVSVFFLFANQILFKFRFNFDLRSFALICFDLICFESKQIWFPLHLPFKLINFNLIFISPPNHPISLEHNFESTTNVQPPNCDKNAHSFRKRRDLNKPGIAAALRTDEIKELSLEVYSGLHVNEADSDEECECLFLIRFRICELYIVIASPFLATLSSSFAFQLYLLILLADFAT